MHVVLSVEKTVSAVTPVSSSLPTATHEAASIVRHWPYHLSNALLHVGLQIWMHVNLCSFNKKENKGAPC